MTRHEIAVIAVKLLGICMIVKALAASSTFVGHILARRSPQAFEELFMTSQLVAGIGAAWLIAGFYCWHSADRLAEQMVDDDPTPVTDIGLRGEDLLSLGSAVVGLFLLWPAVQSLLIAAAEFGLGEESFDQWWSTVYWQETVYAALIEAAFGTWLVLGSRGIAVIIARLRSAGVSEQAGVTELAGDAPAAPPPMSSAPQEPVT